MRRRTIGPALSGLREVLAGQDVLVPSRSCGGLGACTLPVQRFLRHIGAAGFRVKRAVCQEAMWLGRVVFRGCMALNLCLGIAVMGQDSDYQLATANLGRKGGKKNKLSKKRNGPFSRPCLSKIIRKNQNNFTDLHCKGFKHCFQCLFNEP